MTENLHNNPHWNSVRKALGIPTDPAAADAPAAPMTVTALPLSRLRPFRDHPYHVKEDDALSALSESICENGILSPVIVRRLEGTDDYEIISGHRRTKAAELAGLTKVPVILVCGKREAEEETVNVRRLGSRDQESLSLAEAIARLVDEATPPDLKRKKTA